MTLVRTGVDGHEETVRGLTRDYFTEVNRLGSEWFDDESYGVDIPALVGSDIDRLRSGTPAEPLCLAYRDESVVGMGQLHRHDQSTVTAKRVFVSEPHRGNGLGRRLVEQIIDDAAAEGFDTLHLNVSPYHQRAQRLYESLGFETVSPPEWTTVSPELHDEWQFLERSLDG